MEVRMYEEGDLLRGDWISPPPEDLKVGFQMGATISLWAKGSLVTIVSAISLGDERWAVSMLPSKTIGKFPIAIVKEVYHAIRNLTSFHQVRELYTAIDTTNQTYIRWIEFLGFSQKRILKHAGLEGQDLAWYVKTVK